MEKIAFAGLCFPTRQPKGNGNSRVGKAEQRGRVGNALLSPWVSTEPAPPAMSAQVTATTGQE